MKVKCYAVLNIVCTGVDGVATAFDGEFAVGADNGLYGDGDLGGA